ncbi:hypothetical protein KIL84_001070 [Mauremys mutica]|uniref:Uncharacterized protein n=1 Tax=Mauremys mutica TaxID=74926 RepID=A0A9D4AVI5_9SAUR|nr:hypothetical protein KIL84_001070 [Mauremys mutica]
MCHPNFLPLVKAPCFTDSKQWHVWAGFAYKRGHRTAMDVARFDAWMKHANCCVVCWPRWLESAALWLGAQERSYTYRMGSFSLNLKSQSLWMLSSGQLEMMLWEGLIQAFKPTFSLSLSHTHTHTHPPLHISSLSLHKMG